MEIDEFSQTFFRMEMEEDFFSWRTPDANPFWDVVRYELFFSLFEKDEPQSLQNVVASGSLRSKIKKIASVPARVVALTIQWARMKAMRQVDFLALVASRYKDVDGRPADHASIDVLRTFSELGSIRKIESQPGLLHDVNVNILISGAARVYRLPSSLEKYLRDMAEAIADAEQKYFGARDPNLFSVVRREYTSHLVQRQIWHEIIERSNPRFILMTQNGIQKGALIEARKRGVPVVECQHGVISRMHPAYSYPTALQPGEGAVVPDVLLLFSEYWMGQCYMPGTKMLVAGNDRFGNKGIRSTRNGAAVFVTAAFFHKYLSPLAVELARSMPTRAFIMKLHPAQVADQGRIEEEYRGIQNLSVVGTEKSCSELFADASDVVIVQSTASYEALDHGVPVHILRQCGYMSHGDLFTHPDVHLFSTAAELQGLLFRPVAGKDHGLPFFSAFDPSAIREISVLHRRGTGVVA